mmetsp:Transcript_18938/g.42345  ORF Transcript_18938/g.42345 Transcript_18938/m.42345 type:complete len:206 (+) Transcript_18938:51-668(+)
MSLIILHKFFTSVSVVIVCVLRFRIIAVIGVTARDKSAVCEYGRHCLVLLHLHCHGLSGCPAARRPQTRRPAMDALHQQALRVQPHLLGLHALQGRALLQCAEDARAQRRLRPRPSLAPLVLFAPPLATLGRGRSGGRGRRLPGYGDGVPARPAPALALATAPGAIVHGRRLVRPLLLLRWVVHTALILRRRVVRRLLTRKVIGL